MGRANKIGAEAVGLIRAQQPCAGKRWNGPSRWGSVGHKLFAMGLPHHKSLFGMFFETSRSARDPLGQPQHGSRQVSFIRSSFSPIAFPTGFAHLQPTLPHVPAALSWRAERYDGKKEICISSTPHETRLAIIENDELAEIYYERENEYTLAGSIYKGRVTRVLPGMQSAFVDVGLERDAFLYVTDFVELEDQEDSDEVEKAAASGANQAPREIRHTNGGRSGQKPDQKPDQKSDQRQERGPRDRRPAEESAPLTVEAVSSTPEVQVAGPESSDQEDSSGAGGRRWRGRRHRRGGRGQGVPETIGDAGESTGTETETSAVLETAAQIHASASERESVEAG